MNENIIRDIITKYDTVKTSGTTEPNYLWPRFERAALNQISDGATTVSRYAIGADTVKGYAYMAKEKIENKEAIEYLTIVINSLSAFSELQEELDPLNHNK